MDHSSSHQHHSNDQQVDHSSMKGKNHEEHEHHHEHMIEDFKKRFWISLIITLPIIVLAPMIQELLGYELRFNGDRYFQFALSSVIFFYGGWPF